MKHSSALPIEFPLLLPRPISVDDVKSIRPNVFLFQPRFAANANRERPKLRNGIDRAPVRIANRCGPLARLLDAWIAGRRPQYERLVAYGAEEFYTGLCRDGADVVFLIGTHLDSLQRLKLDPILCDIPVVIVDSFDARATASSRDRYLGAGADAVIFVPIDEASIFDAMDAFLPPYRPDPTEA
jgi:hypothetical protein